MASAVPIPRLAGVEHRFVELADLRVHVAEAGQGQAVLLLHGFPQHWWEWRKVIPGLAEQYRVVCPDLRGAGWTDAPATGYDSDQLLADVLGILQVLGLEHVHVIAHDWGALIAYQLCLRHPHLVGRYLALAAPPPWSKFDARFATVAWRLWFQGVIATPVVGPHLLGQRDQGLARYLLSSPSNRDAWSPEDIELFLAPLRDPARSRAASMLYRRLILPEVIRILRGAHRTRRLRTPTRVLVGTDDPLLRREFVAGYEEHVDDLEVEYVSRASHFIADERPDVVLERALAFFTPS